MPRAVYKIINFSGGINNNDDPRDLKDGDISEFVELQGMSIHKGGILKIAGNGTNSYMENNTGDLFISNFANDADIKIKIKETNQSIMICLVM